MYFSPLIKYYHMMNIENFKINKLHKVLNFDIQFRNNTIILLGENGSCKTTIIKMLYYTLSLQWKKLAQYDFESIEITVNSKHFCITKKDISLTFDNRMLRKMPPHIRRYIVEAANKYQYLDFQTIEEICKKFEFPIEFILQDLDNNYNLSDFASTSKDRKNLQKTIKSFSEEMGDMHILYLPTYRRIEQELKVVFRWTN